MIRFAAASVSILALGCVSAPELQYSIDSAVTPAPALAAPAASAPAVDGPAVTAADADPSPALHAAESDAPAAGFRLDAEELAKAPPPSLAAPADPVQHPSLFTIKGGYYSTQDTSALNDGYIINASWTDFFSKVFALEFEVGYLDASGKDAGVNTDLWGIPVMLNGRLNFPVSALDFYGGLGIGSIYYDVSSSGGGLSHDGWVLAGDAFLGTDVHLGDAFLLGLEGKYYLTDKVSVLDGGLDAFALMLTVGFHR